MDMLFKFVYVFNAGAMANNNEGQFRAQRVSKIVLVRRKRVTATTMRPQVTDESFDASSSSQPRLSSSRSQLSLASQAIKPEDHEAPIDP